MRYMMLVRSSACAGPPPAAFREAMGKLTGAAIESGMLVAGGQFGGADAERPRAPRRRQDRRHRRPVPRSQESDRRQRVSRMLRQRTCTPRLRRISRRALPALAGLGRRDRNAPIINEDHRSSPDKKSRASDRAEARSPVDARRNTGNATDGRNSI
jgi:hypothetical protein